MPFPVFRFFGLRIAKGLHRVNRQRAPWCGTTPISGAILKPETEIHFFSLPISNYLWLVFSLSFLHRSSFFCLPSSCCVTKHQALGISVFLFKNSKGPTPTIRQRAPWCGTTPTSGAIFKPETEIHFFSLTISNYLWLAFSFSFPPFFSLKQNAQSTGLRSKCNTQLLPDDEIWLTRFGKSKSRSKSKIESSPQISSQISSQLSNLVSSNLKHETRFDQNDEICDEICMYMYESRHKSRQKIR